MFQASARLLGDPEVTARMVFRHRLAEPTDPRPSVSVHAQTSTKLQIRLESLLFRDVSPDHNVLYLTASVRITARNYRLPDFS